MTLGLLIEIVCFLWAASELALLFFRRSKQPDQNRDARSVVWLNITIYGSLALAIACFVSGFGHVDYANLLFARTGLILIILGLCIRWIAILTLRKYFTVNVAIQASQRLIRAGLYRFVRHPSYSGSLLSFLGLAMVFSNWVVLLIVLAPITVAFIRRIRLEERVLTDAFGAEYTEYCHSSWRLFPGIY
jgi:protein-S-isoprenylcysteine O-methyltransferase Ste14